MQETRLALKMNDQSIYVDQHGSLTYLFRHVKFVAV